TVPNAASGHPAPPVGGWPVLIFQHASYRNREDMFAVADSFADNGFVVAGIDLPLHGITDPADPFYATAANPLYAGLGLPANGSIERTFDLALISPPTIDPTGSHYLNLTSLLTSRDNVREAVADLITFERTLPSLNLGAAGRIDALLAVLPRCADRGRFGRSDQLHRACDRTASASPPAGDRQHPAAAELHSGCPATGLHGPGRTQHQHPSADHGLVLWTRGGGGYFDADCEAGHARTDNS